MRPSYLCGNGWGLHRMCDKEGLLSRWRPILGPTTHSADMLAACRAVHRLWVVLVVDRNALALVLQAVATARRPGELLRPQLPMHLPLKARSSRKPSGRSGWAWLAWVGPWG